MTLITISSKVELDIDTSIIWPDGAPAALTADVVVDRLNDLDLDAEDLLGLLSEWCEHNGLSFSPGQLLIDSEWDVLVVERHPNPAHDPGTPALLADVEPDPTITVTTEARW